jgi:serine/threonine protein kinase
MEMKELSKNDNFLGLSPSALQEMQLLHQIHFLIPNPRGHPNFALPVSIAYDGGVKKADNSSGDTNARSSSPTDLLFSASRINGSISHHGPKDSHERAAIIKGNYLLCCPTPFSLQAVLSLRKRKNEDHHALDVSPIIIQLWFRDLLSALSHCHSNHILLRTIHPNQILIDNSGVAKIGNLYRCHVLHPEERGQDASKDSKTKKGAKEAVDSDDIRSNSYLAPELVFGSPRYTKKSDVWALGCLIAHVILDKILFFGKDRNSVANAMFKVVGYPSSDVAKKFGDYPFFKSILSTVDPSKMKKYKKNVSKAIRTIMNDRSHDSEEYDEILGLLELMLDLDPDKRISASEALEHAAMRNLSIYSLTPQFRQRYVHDWTRFKKQYEESLDKIVASGMEVSEDFLSDDEDDGYNQKKGRKSEDEVLDYFDIEDIVTQSSSKRPRVV